MTAFHRWWFHIWRLPTGKAVVSLLLVALRALLIGSGMMFLLSDLPDAPRALIAAIVGVAMSVITGIIVLRTHLEED